MKKIDMKTIKMIIIFMLGWSLSLCYCAEESTMTTELTREQIIDQAILNFPEIQEGMMFLNSIGFKYEGFDEFLEKNLANGSQEANIGELHCQVTDDLIPKITDTFVNDLYFLLSKKGESLHNTTRKSIVYCTTYKHLPALQYHIKMALDKPYKLEEPLLHEAVIRGNTEIVDYLMTWNVDVDLLHKEWTPLARACQYGYGDIIQILLSAGACIDNKNSSKNIPLFLAIVNRHQEIVTLLLDAGADVNRYHGELNVLRSAILHGRNNFGQNFHAPSLPIIRIILSAQNIKINELCFGSTALHYAARNNDLEVVRILLAAGADTTIPDSTGQIAYQITTSHAVRRLIVQAETQRPMNSCCSIS